MFSTSNQYTQHTTYSGHWTVDGNVSLLLFPTYHRHPSPAQPSPAQPSPGMWPGSYCGHQTPSMSSFFCAHLTTSHFSLFVCSTQNAKICLSPPRCKSRTCPMFGICWRPMTDEAVWLWDFKTLLIISASRLMQLSTVTAAAFNLSIINWRLDVSILVISTFNIDETMDDNENIMFCKVFPLCDSRCCWKMS